MHVMHDLTAILHEALGTQTADGPAVISMHLACAAGNSRLGGPDPLALACPVLLLGSL